MRNPRDIGLVGFGFLLGMVCSYFLMTNSSTPPGNLAMNRAQPPAALTAPLPGAVAVPHAGRFREVNLELFNWAEPFTPGERHLGIVPAEVKDRKFSPLNAPRTPHGVQQYDLIDLNYVPDFKIDLK